MKVTFTSPPVDRIVSVELKESEAKVLCLIMGKTTAGEIWAFGERLVPKITFNQISEVLIGLYCTLASAGLGYDE